MTYDVVKMSYVIFKKYAQGRQRVQICLPRFEFRSNDMGRSKITDKSKKVYKFGGVSNIEYVADIRD